MTTHPLPWRVARDTDANAGSGWDCLVVDSNGEVVADCGILGRTQEENEAATRAIVEAVNLWGDS